MGCKFVQPVREIDQAGVEKCANAIFLFEQTHRLHLVSSYFKFNQFVTLNKEYLSIANVLFYLTVWKAETESMEN